MGRIVNPAFTCRLEEKGLHADTSTGSSFDPSHRSSRTVQLSEPRDSGKEREGRF